MIVYSLNGTILSKHSRYKVIYDYAVADHVFEHVSDPDELAKSIRHCLKPGAHSHVGIPDASFFTDRFYRLIHRNGGRAHRPARTRVLHEPARRHGFFVVEVTP